MLILDSEKDRVTELAKKLGTSIPSAISLVAWPLPILEALVSKIEKLEKELKNDRSKAG